MLRLPAAAQSPLRSTGKRQREDQSQPAPPPAAPLFSIPEIKGVLTTKEEAAALAAGLTGGPKEMDIQGGRYWVKKITDKRLLYTSAPLLQRIPNAARYMVLPNSQFDVGPYAVQVFAHEGTDLIETPSGVICANMETIKADLTDILAYLKENRLIHRDIKPDNLIWTGSHVKLIDLDALLQLREGDEYKDTTFAGTEEYLPEDARYGRFAIEDGNDGATDAHAVQVSLQNIVKMCSQKSGRKTRRRRSRAPTKTRKNRVHYKKNRKH